MANTITVVGRLVRDAEVKSGKSSEFMVFALADDAARDNTIFHECICFNGGLTKAMSQYLTKGKPIYVSGHLEDNSYDNNGTKIRRNQIVVDSVNFLNIGNKDQEGKGSDGGSRGQSSPKPQQESNFAADDDDDIPF